MRKFQIIRLSSDECRLVELYAYNGICRDFSGRNNVADAIRHLDLICSDRLRRSFDIVTVSQVVNG